MTCVSDSGLRVTMCYSSMHLLSQHIPFLSRSKGFLTLRSLHAAMPYIIKTCPLSSLPGNHTAWCVFSFNLNCKTASFQFSHKVKQKKYAIGILGAYIQINKSWSSPCPLHPLAISERRDKGKYCHQWRRYSFSFTIVRIYSIWRHMIQICALEIKEEKKQSPQNLLNLKCLSRFPRLVFLKGGERGADLFPLPDFWQCHRDILGCPKQELEILLASHGLRPGNSPHNKGLLVTGLRNPVQDENKEKGMGRKQHTKKHTHITQIFFFKLIIELWLSHRFIKIQIFRD